MASQSFNDTSFENGTSGFDFFCQQLFVGPLIWSIFTVCCASLAIPTSIWLLWVLFKRRRSGLTNDVYMSNITVMDVVFNILVLPCLINFHFIQDTTGLIATKLIYSFNIGGHPLFMTCLCVDCYIAVVHPITYMKSRTSKHRIAICGVVWALTITYGMLFISDLKIFTSLATVIPYGIALPTIMFCDVLIFRALRKPGPSRKTEIHPQKQRALQTVINSLVLTLVSYLPPMVMFMVSVAVFSSNQEMLCRCSLPTLIYPMIGSTVQTFLHLGNLGVLKSLAGLACPHCQFIKKVADLLKEPDL